MRGSNAWRRCGLCGLFMSYADLEVAVAEDPTRPSDMYPTDPEDFIRYHKACHDGFVAKYQGEAAREQPNREASN